MTSDGIRTEIGNPLLSAPQKGGSHTVTTRPPP